MYDETFIYGTPLLLLTADELVVKSTTGDIFVTTHIDYKKIYREPAASEAACPTLPANSPGVSKSDDGFSYANGICTYQTNTNLFPVGVERSASASCTGTPRSPVPTPRPQPQDAHPQEGDDADYKVIEGKDISLTVAELMEISAWTSTNLSTTAQRRGARDWPSRRRRQHGRVSAPRLTGVRVSVAINYDNDNLDDTEGSELGSSGIYAVVEIESQLARTSRGRTSGTGPPQRLDLPRERRRHPQRRVGRHVRVRHQRGGHRQRRGGGVQLPASSPPSSPVWCSWASTTSWTSLP